MSEEKQNTPPEDEHGQQPKSQSDPVGEVQSAVSQAADPPPSPDDVPEPTTDEKQMAMLAHLLGGIFGFLVPLILWIVKKEESRFVDDQGKEALNFQISIMFVYIISVPLMFICIGYLTFLGAFVCSIIFGILGGMEAQKGLYYRYPVSIRLIK